MGPPLAADFGIGDIEPLIFVEELDVGEELIGFRVEENGICGHAVFAENGLEFGPDG